MKAYGRNLRWIENHQYGDEMHTGIPPAVLRQETGTAAEAV